MKIKEKTSTEPFLRWAGGKRWFINKYSSLIESYEGKYIEPFLGSGAVYFSLLPKKATLADINEELINTYIQIRDNHLLVEAALQKLKHSKLDYYKIRSWKPTEPYNIAARFLYLNRTCWNGLWRVNQKGEFNVPKGTKSIDNYPPDNFESLSQILKRTKLKVWNFKKTIGTARLGDFIFADPPYTVRHNYNGFVKYNENIFSWENQVELADSLKRAVERGVNVMCTNANHQSIKDLYPESHFEQIVVERYSSISSKINTRKAYQELIIKSR